MPDEQTGAQVLVVSADDVSLAVSESVDAATDAQTDEILSKVDEVSRGLETKIETVGYEQDVKLEGLPAATADELERREAARAEQAKTGESQQETATIVQLDETQWQYVHDSLALQSTCDVLLVVLVSAVLGSRFASSFIERWRS